MTSDDHKLVHLCVTRQKQFRKKNLARPYEYMVQGHLLSESQSNEYDNSLCSIACNNEFVGGPFGLVPAYPPPLFSAQRALGLIAIGANYEYAY